MTSRDHICLVFTLHRRGRLRHWHWPRRDIVNCTNSAKERP